MFVEAFCQTPGTHHFPDLFVVSDLVSFFVFNYYRSYEPLLVVIVLDCLILYDGNWKFVACLFGNLRLILIVSCLLKSMELLKAC